MFVSSMTTSQLAAFIKSSIREGIQEVKNEFSLLPDDEFGYCTIDIVTQRFKVTKATVHNWAKKGSVKKYKISGRTLYKLSEIESTINRPIY